MSGGYGGDIDLLRRSRVERKFPTHRALIQKFSVRRTGIAFQSLAALLIVAGIGHFAMPDTYDAIIPHLLPWSPRSWTYGSGAIEIVLAIGVVCRRTRRRAATLSAVFFVLVFPANIQMLIDSTSDAMVAIAAARLPVQLPLVWLAWRVRTHAPLDERNACRDGTRSLRC